LVGYVLATFIASLGVRYRMNRTKIQEFLKDWTNTELSIVTIDSCIRETGIACVPVVEELVEQLQQADILHLDQTHWYESGKLHWLAAHIGQWILDDLRALIATIASASGDHRLIRLRIAGLRRVCHLGKKAELPPPIMKQKGLYVMR
jgi:hypothetical protein